MTTFQRLIHGRVDPADHRQLQQEAAARGVSMTACVGDCLREYFALRIEMASAVTAPGKPGERHTGLIHSILARTEERLAATLDARTTELGLELRRREIMLYRLVFVYLLHTPEVPHELQAGAWTSANRRYANYRKFVDEALGKDDLNGERVDGEPARTQDEPGCVSTQHRLRDAGAWDSLGWPIAGSRRPGTGAGSRSECRGTA